VIRGPYRFYKSFNNQIVNFLDFHRWKGYFQTIAGIIGQGVFPALETELGHFQRWKHTFQLFSPIAT